MTAMQLTRSQQREMKKLTERVDRVSQADRRFFERFPHRKHRVRFASEAECKQQFILDGGGRLPVGHQCYIAVRNVKDGVRLRLFLRAPEGRETDLSEEIAEAIYEAVSTDQTRAIEASLRQAIAEGRV